jgi:hypothetical protein
MPTVPTDALAAAQFLFRHLYRPIELTAGETLFAVAETEHAAEGDDWLWTDDNAKVLEFVSRPEIWARFPRESAEMLRFVQAMCRGPFIFRRVSPHRLERVDGEGAVGRFVHSLMHVRSELPRGAVMAGIRFHDGRTADNLVLGGNVVEFTYRRRRFRLNIAEAITDVAADQRDGVLTLRHSGDLHFKARWQAIRLGRMTYVYTIDAGSMLVGAEAVLEVDPTAAVSDVVLTIGHDHLSHGVNGVRYNSIAGLVAGGSPAAFVAGEPGRHILPAKGAPYYSIAQSEIAGFALCVHSAPRDPDRLAEIEVQIAESGWLHLARARYRFDGPCRGARLAVAEDKMLTAGGFYDRVGDYAELMRHALAQRSSQRAVVDYSVSYDYGAEINAFAKCFAVCTGEDAAPDWQALGQSTKDAFDTYLKYYDECFVAGHRQNKNTILSRQLAFVIMGIATMYRATGAKSYLEKLKELSDVLLDFEVQFEGIGGEPASAFPYGIHTQRAAWVDGHSSALLALTLARRHLDNPRFTTAIDRGLASYCWETCGVGGGPNPHKIDLVSTGIVLDGLGWHTENSYWNFNVGLTLRFFNSLRSSIVPELQAIAAKHRGRIELFEMVMRRQIERSITERDDAIEIRTSIYSGETTSETQPGVMLGLLGHPYD